MRRYINLLLLLFLAKYVSSRCECVNKIVMLHNSEDFRIVASPDYPRYYCPNIDCIWRIVAPDNTSKAYFYADNLDMRDHDDRIIFYDHKFLTETDNETETHSCTGDEICHFASSGQYMTIRFTTSSGDVNNYGFQGIVSAKDKPVYALLTTLNSYCLPIIFILFGLFGVLFSIIMCKSQKTEPQRVTLHQKQALTVPQKDDPEMPKRYQKQKRKQQVIVRQSI